jgi:hypothetical protein
MREFVLTRLRPHADAWEDAGWLGPIGGGTDEIMREILARGLASKRGARIRLVAGAP